MSIQPNALVRNAVMATAVTTIAGMALGNGIRFAAGGDTEQDFAGQQAATGGIGFSAAGIGALMAVGDGTFIGHVNKGVLGASIGIAAGTLGALVGNRLLFGDA